MAQCTPDLSAGDCLACLRRLVDMVNSTMALRMGAQIHVIRCYFRYEAYQFYDSQPMLRLGPVPAPAPAPTILAKHNSKTMRPKAGSQELQGDELVLDRKNSEFSVFDFEQILEATDNFSDENKLGEGGFSAVYKAWQLWDDGRWIDLVDASLVPKSHSAEMTKCIKIALLCVQENATDRPTMAEVVAMLSLSSETAMIVAEPKQPAYFNVRVGNEETSTATESCSINDVTISVTTPR
ncbi:unnamed protein product [Miscanthus lutarioriparius]|uniref:Gnk2-homologous domain-containing protein n=1 Tax=Miscanthus lutarioriparius TaxID=422564 RepID=A0A811SNY7_9POAL|nr:unnamed protein product [Miscanthus lutarioriparius]